MHAFTVDTIVKHSRANTCIKSVEDGQCALSYTRKSGLLKGLLSSPRCLTVCGCGYRVHYRAIWQQINFPAKIPSQKSGSCKPDWLHQKSTIHCSSFYQTTTLLPGQARWSINGHMSIRFRFSLRSPSFSHSCKACAQQR